MTFFREMDMADAGKVLRGDCRTAQGARHEKGEIARLNPLFRARMDSCAEVSAAS